MRVYLSGTASQHCVNFRAGSINKVPEILGALYWFADDENLLQKYKFTLEDRDRSCQIVAEKIAHRDQDGRSRIANLIAQLIEGKFRVQPQPHRSNLAGRHIAQKKFIARC